VKYHSADALRDRAIARRVRKLRDANSSLFESSDVQAVKLNQQLSTTFVYKRSDLIRYAILFYSAALPSPHSIIFSHRNELIFRRNFFKRTAKNRLPTRQKSELLNSKANFADSESTRFQGLSMTIGRFLRTSPRHPRQVRREKYPQPWLERNHYFTSAATATKYFFGDECRRLRKRTGHWISAKTIGELRQAIIRIEPERPAAPRFVSLSAAGADPIGPVQLQTRRRTGRHSRGTGRPRTGARR
jgi:hypothetical protein